MLNLKITIDSSSGFCFGVIYAIAMAEDILQEEEHLYCLGDIVHNDEEVDRLKRKGLKIIDHKDLEKLHDQKILIRAHGEPSSTYEIASRNNLEIIDASCPVVLKLQNRIKNSYDKDGNIFIYGKHGHAEVVGLLSQTENKATIFEKLEELDIASMPRKIVLYSQTTKSTDKFYEIKKVLNEAGIEVETNDTICRQVSNRDLDLKIFASKYDIIIFVSGIKSSNGKVLYEVCKKINVRSYFVSKVEDIKKEWFHSGESVGICGATSTPMWLMETIRENLKNL